MTHGIGNILSRQLLQYFGSAETVFHEKRQLLEKVPGIGQGLSSEIKKSEALKRAEQELSFIEKNNISVFFFGEESYPARLKECPDAPLLFYFKGNANLNANKIISIVGTRQATPYGRESTQQLISDLAESYPELLIISGLAYGIDICAHRCALQENLPTVGILAHGLDRIYPSAHRNTAIEMLKNGGLLSDFPSMTDPDRPNFLKRNRLIAGLADATIVIESAAKGGSLVTADIAFSYGRDVFTFPGRTTDIHSKGCNELIRQNKAGLITSAEELVSALCWDKQYKREQQTELCFTTTDTGTDGSPVMQLLAHQEAMSINEMAQALQIPVNELSVKLFELEMEGKIELLPGNRCKKAIR